MTDDQQLAPLRAPQRVFTDIEPIASTLLALRRDVQGRLASIDENAGALLEAVGTLRSPLERIDRKVEELETSGRCARRWSRCRAISPPS